MMDAASDWISGSVAARRAMRKWPAVRANRSVGSSGKGESGLVFRQSSILPYRKEF